MANPSSVLMKCFVCEKMKSSVELPLCRALSLLSAFVHHLIYSFTGFQVGEKRGTDQGGPASLSFPVVLTATPTPQLQTVTLYLCFRRRKIQQKKSARLGHV